MSDSQNALTLHTGEVLAKDQIKGYHCQHVFYSQRKDERGSADSDMLFVKEQVVLQDGTRHTNLRLRFDEPRPFYITKPMFRNHTDKLEYTDLNKVDYFESPQYSLADNVARQLRYYGKNAWNMRALASTNHLYGTDISPTSLFRNKYRQKWPDLVPPTSSLAVIDSETCVKLGPMYQKTIIVTISFKEKCYVGILEDWLGGFSVNCKALVMPIMNEYIGEILNKRGITSESIDLFIGKTPAEIIARGIRRLHEWQPDFVGVWNLDYDMVKFIQGLTDYDPDRFIHALKGTDDELAEIFSDPMVPDGYKYFKYWQGKDTHVAQDGKARKLKHTERWHTVESPASFQWIDMMLYYYQRRKSGGMLSVGLNACLERHGIEMSKLDFDCGVPKDTVDWHKKMQDEFKLIYIVYALLDCIVAELLDEKTMDCSVHLVNSIAYSDLRYLTSLPKKFIDGFHYNLLKNGSVLGTVSDSLRKDYDKILVDVDDWIITLPSHALEPVGIPVIKEIPDLKSCVFIHLSDADVVRTYPSVGINLNIGRTTTYKEATIKLKGMTEQQRREFGVNWTGGKVNAIELCVNGLGLPYPDELLKMFDEGKLVRR